MNCFTPQGLPGNRKPCYVIGWLCLLALVPPGALAQSLTVPNGNMESPTVGAWSTMLPGSWTWAVGPGSGSVGLTSTGGANGTQQTFWGNNIAGTLTSAILPQTLSSPALLALHYWTKRENTGPFTLTATLRVGGTPVASRSDVIGTNAWTPYTLDYNAQNADLGKSLQVQFTFTNGSGAWQGYWDEASIHLFPPSAPLPAIAPAVYPYELAPAAYPDYTRRLLPSPDWSVFQNQPQFVGSRYTGVDENYFTTRWQPYQFEFTPANSGTATLRIQNVDCDGTVLVDNVVCQPASSSPQLLQNPDFEGSGGWSGGSYTTAQAHGGTHSMLVGTNSSLNASPRPSTIQAGHTYVCSVWAKTSGTGQWVIIFGNWQAGGTSWWVNRPTVNNDWEQFQFLLTPTALTGNYNQFAVISQPGGPAIYVDDFSVKELLAAGTNLLANPDFEAADPGQGWTRTAGTNPYQDGYQSRHAMLLRAGNRLETTVNVQAGQPYKVTAWLSIAGRSQGQVQISLGGSGLGTTSFSVAEETADMPSGLVYWPNVSTLVNSIGGTTLNSWTNHGVMLHNPGGYGPGSPWTGSYGQCLASTNTLTAITNALGSRYTGGDIGEQDARFANVFEGCYEPFSLTSKFRLFRTAHRYQGQVGDDLGHITSLLVNLWLWHYPIKDGTVLMSGAQTQPKEGISNSQLQYSFLRGAGKQYGVPWFGNVSVFSSDWLKNGINHKSYPNAPTNGNSLSLMRRLLFTHYLYGCRILSFEGGQRTSQGTVSPIGLVQEALVQTVNQYGQAGVMHTPVALLLDYWSGWMPAQYNRGGYYTWNGLDYGLGDFLTHNVFSLLYPNYEANGFYQNELGGLSDTPYGDIADTLLSDVSSPVLNRYGVVIAAGDLASADTELRDKVEGFLAGGGNFIVTAENALRLWPEFGIGPGQISIPANGAINWVDSSTTMESNPGVLYSVATGSLPAGYNVLGTYAGSPAVIDIPRSAGVITLLLSPYGLNRTALTSLHPATAYNVPLPKPYLLMGHVQKLLAIRLSSQRLFSVGNANLGYVTCRQAPGQYLVGLHNNSLNSQSFSITSLIGPITNLTELNVGASVTNQLGYWPLGYEMNDGGASDSSHVFGGDIRLFRVQVAETNGLRLVSSNVPPARPLNRMVTVPALCNLKDTIQQWYNFFAWFDGVKLDWTSVRNADLGFTNGSSWQMHEPIAWLKRQQVRFVADFSSGFITRELTLQTNAPGTNYAQTLAQFSRAMDKLSLLGRATDILISAEDIPSGQPAAFKAGVSALCTNAAARGIMVHFKHRKTPWTPDIAATLNFLSSVGASNLRFAANTADAPSSIGGLLAQAGGQLGLILIAPPASGSSMDLAPVRSHNVIEILDAGYGSWDSVYRDCRTAWMSSGAAALAGSPLGLSLETYWTTHTNNASRFLNFADTADLPGALRQQTNFWRYFGGAKVDYKYLAYRDPQQCAREGKWLANRKVQLVVDFSSDLNNYPGLTLTDSSNPNDGLSANYERSVAIMNSVFEKMQLMGVTNCILRPTTTNTAAYADICNRAWARGKIIVHLQHYMANWMTTYQSPGSVAGIIDGTAPANVNMKMAINGCHDSNLSGLFATAGSRLGLILLGYPGSSRADVHGPARLGMNVSALSGRTQPKILDSEYGDWNDVALDLAYLGWNVSTPPLLAYSQITTNTPVFGMTAQAGNNIAFGGAGGAPGANYYVLCTSNLSMPLANWMFWNTNQFDAFGNFTITDSLALPQRFYRLLMY